MKRNWFAIITIIGLIISYEAFYLRPLNKKRAEEQAKLAAQSPALQAPVAETAISPAPVQGAPTSATPASSAKPNAVTTLSRAQLLATEKRIELPAADRSVAIYENASVGDVVYKKYFQRGKATKESVRTIPNTLQWASSNENVDSCLKSLKRNSDLSFSGSFGDVKCEVHYKQNGLRLGTEVVIQSEREIKGDLFFQNQDALGTGPQFDHNYLTLKRANEKVEKIRDKALYETPVRKSGPYEWISWGDKYFATILLPSGRFNPDVFYSQGADVGNVFWGIAYPLKWMPDTKSTAYSFDVYFALKDAHELRSVNSELDDSIDFGFFSPIAKFMLWSLESLNRIFKNFGVSIIILSLLIRLLLWPVNKKMFESGQKMKELQPQMQAIKKKYEGKSDQMLQMNAEVRQLYQKAGVNPLGSCLPVFLQIPIFFGLNTALSNAVDLYQAPFFGWITDLSYKDPLYVLPIVWTISLIISVELNPQQASQPGMPDMKWVSRVMFVVFGFVSKDFPAGLNLYFLVSNLAGMAQQYLVKKKTQMGKEGILVSKES